MPIETNDILPFFQWLPGALVYWAVVVGCLAVAGVILGWLFATLRKGPVTALVSTGRTLAGAAVDLACISPRRVLALAMLAVREAIRRKVVVVFIVFLVVMLFAGWFLKAGSDHPARLYIGMVVLPTSLYLTLLMALFLSALSLPTDIKNRTLHTVVTKPVRQSEIVLGRILGIATIGTLMLAGMGLISYVFTIRGLSHTHELTAADLHEEPAAAGQPPVLKGLTGKAQNHRHAVTIGPSGDAFVEPKQGHWHEVKVTGSGKSAVYTLGPPQGMLVARVPIYGKLRFKDRAGNDVERGINTGDEWAYRSFIEGATQQTAIWTFEGITEDAFPESMFPDGLLLEMTIEVFRTYKGDVEKPITGALWVRNPQTGEKVEVRVFLAKKFATDTQLIPRRLEQRRADGTVEKTYDLFKDLVSDDGRLEVWMQCLEHAQYFGMAQPDVYFHASDASFAANFAKGYLGIWLQMVLVVGFGVMFSTFLSAPVAWIATLGALVGGMAISFIIELASGKMIGGGPMESFRRLVEQQNMISELQPGLQTNVIQMFDQIIRWIMWGVSSVLPSFGDFDWTNYVAYGFDVGPDLLLKSLCRAVAFLIPLVVAGYIFLKVREVAR